MFFRMFPPDCHVSPNVSPGFLFSDFFYGYFLLFFTSENGVNRLL